MKNYDILIVGCGPVGACLALQMRNLGYTVGIFDKETSIYHHPRAMLLDDEGARTYQNMGLWEDMKQCITTFRSGQTVSQSGKVLGQLVFPLDKPYGHTFTHLFYQPELEKIFRDHFTKKQGIDLFIGHEVTEVVADSDEVRVVAKDLSDNSLKEFTGKYVIGCDGAKSLVKKLIPYNRIDQNYSQDWWVIDVFIKDEKNVHRLPTDFQAFTGEQPVTYVPGVGMHRRLDFRISPEDFELSDEELKAQMPKYLAYVSKDIELDMLEIIRADRYTYRASTADTWRKGRVIIAGDAAHLMPPFAGQGMQSGLRDAFNLSYKLDLVMQGKAGDKLLNTYDEERIPNVIATTKGSIFTGNMNEAQDIFTVALRTTLFTIAKYSKFLQKKLLLSMMKKIPIESGFIGSNHKSAGKMFIQPPVKNLAGKELLMDDLIGNQISIIANFKFPKEVIDTLYDKTGGKIFSLKFDLIDNAYLITDWMKQNKVDFIVIRPDRFIFDAGKKGQENQVLNSLYSFFI